jgi:hypothetical protein
MAALSGYVIYSSFAASASGANRFVSPSGSDTANNCVDSAHPCKTINQAYQMAGAGETVELAAGDYGDQTINNKSGAAGPNVVIQPAPGAAVALGDINWCGADFVTLKGPITAHGLSTYSCYSSFATNVVIDGVIFDWNYTYQSDGGIVWVGGNTQNWIVRNSEIKRGYNVKGFYMSSWGGYYPTNITLEYSKVHDWKSDVGIHTECVFTNKVQGLTLRGNQFYNCVSTGDGLIGNAGTDTLPPRDFLFENNVFEMSWNGIATPGQSVSGHGVSVDGAADYLYGHNVFRYNLFETGMFTGSGSPPPGATVEFYGNIGEPPPCSQVTTSANNIWRTRTCGPTDTLDNNITDQSNFVGPTAHPSTTTHPVELTPGNWRPSSASATQVDKGALNSTCSAFGQLNAGSSPCWPSVDAAEATRFSGAAPDLGPYEYTGSKPGDVNHDGKVGVVDLSVVLSNYGKSTTTGDCSGDGKVTVIDLSIVLNNYGK